MGQNKTRNEVKTWVGKRLFRNSKRNGSKAYYTNIEGTAQADRRGRNKN